MRHGLPVNQAEGLRDKQGVKLTATVCGAQSEAVPFLLNPTSPIDG